MRKIIAICLSALSSFGLFAAPVGVVFDTDMGNDCDDVMAQLMLLSYANEGKADILCIASNKDNALSPKFLRLVCDFYGFKNVPIFAVKDGAAKFDGSFLRATLEAKNADSSPKFPLANPDEKFGDSVKGLRRVLAAAEDSSVVYISVGFLTNLARLAASQPDEISPLSGRELLAKKVRFVSAMAGAFATDHFGGRRDWVFPEYNVKEDLPSARAFLENPPCDVVLSPFEVGLYLRFPYYSVMRDFFNAPENPASFACDAYVKGLFLASKRTSELDRYMWDLTSVLYAFEPAFFKLSPRGNVELASSGATVFVPSKSGKIRYLILPKGGEKRIVDRCVELCKLQPR